MNQIINALPEEKKNRIPIKYINFFAENDKRNEKYIIDPTIMEENDLEEETLGFLKIINHYINSIEYESLKPSWKILESEGKIEEACILLEKELKHNFYLINNRLSDRILKNEDKIFNIRYFGITENRNKSMVLKPYKMLLNVLVAIDANYKEDNIEKFNSMKFVYYELIKNLKI